MKKLLFALALLFTIPFNASCVKEIVIKVTVTGNNCTWEEPVRDAIFAKDYSMKFIPDPNYYLYDGDFEVKNKVHDISLLHLYDPDTQMLTIPGTYVTSDITIHAEADQEGPELNYE